MAPAYQAYLSYSHADARFAAWLHRALETYRLPRALRGRFGRYPLRPVFRDRAELRTSQDLQGALKVALRDSSALIVVCSNAASASRWVNEEIEQFCAMHGGERVFCVIARDTPPECFPASLPKRVGSAAAEPIAADARREVDGQRGALLKLVAALLDVQLDELIQRDARRRYRLMSIAAVGATGVAGITFALALVAFNARNVAERRSAQAEDLIGFMLGDLRSRLSPIGRLDVLDAVGEKAMAYFASLQDSDITAASRLGRAQALRQIGEVRMAQGNVDEALAAFRASSSQARSLLDSAGAGDVAAIFEVSQSDFWIGYAQFTRRELADARLYLERYLARASDLHSRAPQENKYETEVAYAHSNLGTLDLFEGRFDSADRHFGATAEIETRQLRTAPTDPELKRNLAETLSWLGTVAASSISIGEAIVRFEAEHDLRMEIAAMVADKRHDEKVADSAMLLGHQLFLAGDLVAARTRFEEARIIGDGLTAYDPNNAMWSRLRAYATLELAVTATADGRFDSASNDIAHAVDEIRVLCNRDPNNTERRVDLVSMLTQQAIVLRLQNEIIRARASLDEALQRMPTIDADYDINSRVSIAGLHLLDGDLDSAEGKAAQALAAWSQGLAVIGEMPTVREPSALLTRLTLLERTGRSQDAAAPRTQLAEMGFKEMPSRALAAALVDGVRDTTLH